MAAQEVIDPRVFDILTDVALSARLPDGRVAVFGVQITGAELTGSREVRSDGIAKHELPIHMSGKLVAVNLAAAEELGAMGVIGLEKLKQLL